jgi:hypothetical protein
MSPIAPPPGRGAHRAASAPRSSVRWRRVVVAGRRVRPSASAPHQIATRRRRSARAPDVLAEGNQTHRRPAPDHPPACGDRRLASVSSAPKQPVRRFPRPGASRPSSERHHRFGSGPTRTHRTPDPTRPRPERVDQHSAADRDRGRAIDAARVPPPVAGGCCSACAAASNFHRTLVTRPPGFRASPGRARTPASPAPVPTARTGTGRLCPSTGSRR